MLIKCYKLNSCHILRLFVNHEINNDSKSKTGRLLIYYEGT